MVTDQRFFRFPHIIAMLARRETRRCRHFRVGGAEDANDFVTNELPRWPARRTQRTGLRLAASGFERQTVTCRSFRCLFGAAGDRDELLSSFAINVADVQIALRILNDAVDSDGFTRSQL